jgi:hypothetical protein
VERLLSTTKYNTAKTLGPDGEYYKSRSEVKFAIWCRSKGFNYKREIPFILIKPFDIVYKNGEKEHVWGVKYNADFVIGKCIIDVKGGNSTKTSEFKIKWKLMKLIYGKDYLFCLVSEAKDFEKAERMIIDANIKKEDIENLYI